MSVSFFFCKYQTVDTVKQIFFTKSINVINLPIYIILCSFSKQGLIHVNLCNFKLLGSVRFKKKIDNTFIQQGCIKLISDSKIFK